MKFLNEEKSITKHCDRRGGAGRALAEAAARAGGCADFDMRAQLENI